MILIRTKVGEGTEENPFKPDMSDIEFKSWVIIEERETEYVVDVELLD